MAFESPAAAQGRGETWRSELYPADWQPGPQQGERPQLPDFSYAGYHRGERQIPDRAPGRVVNAARPPYRADASGRRDSSEAIQRALDDVGRAGGGTVYLPAGRYLVAPRDDANEALWIRHRGVVLRGAGAGRTRIENTEAVMRSKAVIRVQPDVEQPSWYNPSRKPLKLAGDPAAGSDRVSLESLDDIEPGQWLVLTHDVTEAFVAEHRQGLVEHWAGRLQGIALYRQVTAVDRESKTIEIDIPARYELKVRDEARAYPVADHLDEVGIEHLSLGMREHPPGDFAFNAYQESGTAAYNVHASYAVRMTLVVNGWIRGVQTFRPRGNREPHHLVSNGILLRHCRSVTLEDCDLQQAQYRGGGGNGYGYVLMGNDNLVKDCRGEELRYVFDFKTMAANGNVVLRGESRGTSDFHMHLSVTNLIDNVHMSGGGVFNAAYRGSAGTIPHGLTTNNSVFWNLRGSGSGDHVLRVSGQSDAVRVIGTGGSRSSVEGIDPKHRERFEGLGRGDALEPRSLYEDQLQRRVSRGEQ